MPGGPAAAVPQVLRAARHASGNGEPARGGTLSLDAMTQPRGTQVPFADRIAQADWPHAEAALDADGFAVLPSLLASQQCAELSAAYDDAALFRSRIVMARHNFGRGEYQYFRYPLPPQVSALREALYARLVTTANRWQERMKLATRFPASHAEFIARCHAAGQVRPTPLLLRYGPDDYNCLHQDLYGEHVFPLQVIVLLSRPGEDFTGGELVMTQQRPRMQSRVMVLPLAQGDAAVIAVHQRPVEGARGSYRVNLRHGVSRIRSGRRHTLGIVLHDAA